MIKTIVLPIDLNDEQSWREALPTALDYARHKGARLHVLTVVPNSLVKMTVVAQLIPENFEEKLRADSGKLLAALIGGQAPEGQSVEQAVRLGGIHQEILRYCRDVRADLIVMASHKPELKDYLLGPNAAHIVRHADCSVWVVRD